MNKDDTEQQNIILNNALLNVYSLGLLQPLLKKSYLPITKSSISPANMVPILNDVVINRRKNILEFGAGASTILLSRLIKKNSLSSKIISIEHDISWINVLYSIVKKEKLERIVDFIHAPLVQCPMAIEKNLWYDISILDKGLSQEKLFDLTIIDGPPAYDATKIKARYPALPYIYSRMAEEFSVYLDDVERVGEQFIIKKWQEEFKINFTILYGTLGYFQKGNSYNFDVVKRSYLTRTFE